MAHPDDPLGIAREHMLMEAAETHCPHGVDRWERRGKLAITGSEWICGCCLHIFFGPMPEGGRCRDCEGS